MPSSLWSLPMKRRQRARAEARGIAEELAARVPEAHLADFMELPRIRALLQPVHFTDEVSIGEDADAD